MRFYDREQELSELKEMQRQSFEDHSRMTILTGRRRIGKTCLGQLAIRDSKSVYLFVGRKDEAILCSEFIGQIKSVLGDVPSGMKTFREVFKLLMMIGQSQNFNLFIDEFQEFYYINKSVFSDIQNIWDQYRRTSHVNLILSGSVYVMMEKIFKDEKEPLFGRADKEICLRPFSTDVMRQIMRDNYPGYTNDDLLALYSITGGVPKYIELLANNKCLTIEKMINFTTRQDSLFIDEGRNLLVQEFGKNYGIYFSILQLIANGELTQREIQGKMVDSRNIGGQLRMLEEDYDLITKYRPIKAKEGSQTVKFEIKDNFLRFWFRYFDKYRSLIEIGNFKMLGTIIKNDYPVFSGFALERWFRQKFMESQNYVDIGGWWLPQSRDPEEIDIVTEDLEGNVNAWEVRRQRKKYISSLLEEKASVMQSRIFKSHNVQIGCLSLEEM
ncbi:MAG: ATP-binding protein [Prevotella sp.]|jgi:AAA+ ATPase superfamily predicted ATPase|nr:ATP-binding protein [Prevotella sp.]MCI2087505.1 ATP-binding protein [Prevotella sp.]MCI2124943.1 ATP-binding protein [Prevotella sp.]